MAYVAFHTNICTQVKGGSNQQLLWKIKENITKLTWKNSPELAKEHIYNSNPKCQQGLVIKKEIFRIIQMLVVL